MTPSIALPASATRPTFAARLRPHRKQLVTGVALGLAVEVLLDEKLYGFSWALFAVLGVAALIAMGGKEAWQSAGSHRWMLLGAMALVMSTMVHDAAWLSSLCVMVALVMASLAALGWNGERKLAQLRTGQLLASPFVTLGRSVHATAVVTSSELRAANVGSVFSSHFPTVMRLCLIVGPPAIILLGLLSSGDAVFRARLASVLTTVFSVEIANFIQGSMVTGISAVLMTGVFGLVSSRRGVDDASEPSRWLKPLETYALLGTLTAMLLAFGLMSTPCALAPSACELPEGVTYADAAHEGFFQLLFAAMGILALTMALPARTQVTSKGFTAMSTALVLATAPMLISAVARLWRYETTYGLTVLRLMAYAGLFLVAAVLAWRAVTLWAFNDAFVGGAFALLTSTLLGLAVLSPDAFIARRNVQMENVDVAYLIMLSDDALPSLNEASDRLPDPPYVKLKEVLKYRAERLGESESWLTWNLGRSRARAALATLVE
ncbi:MAG: DUF4153 domain-containing protein [Archangium sp.]